MIKFIKGLFKRKPVTNEFKTVEQSEYVRKVVACKRLIAMHSDRTRHLTYQHDPTNTKYDWDTVYARDDEMVEKYKQELLVIEADKLLGNIK